MLEATLVLGMLLQRFEFGDHASYQLEVSEAMTLKPVGLTVTVRPRTGRTWGASPRRVEVGLGTDPTVPATPARETPTVAAGRHATPLLVLYGSNLGTAEDLAARLVREAVDRGYAARSAPLDDHTDDLPSTGAVVVVTASYNGQPPDNAGRFCSWLAGVAPSGAASEVRFAVFGCGNRDWAETYQRVPMRIDEELAAYGATRVHARGEGDARGDFDGQFEAWCVGLWDAAGLRARTHRSRHRQGGLRAPAGRPHREPTDRQPRRPLVPGPAGDGSGEPRAHDGRGGGRPLGASPGARAPGGDVLRRG